MSVTLDQEELKAAEGLLCLLSITVEILTRPWLKSTDSLQKQNTQGWDDPSPTVAILPRMEMASVWCWLRAIT